MSRRTVVGAAILGGAGLLGLRESGAFSAATGDRSFSVGTTGDDTAFLGIEPGDPEKDELKISGTDGETVPILTLTNNSSAALDSVTVTSTPVGSPSINLSDIDTPRGIPNGASRTVTAELDCSQGGSDVPVRLDIEVSGADGSVSASRELSVTCEVPDDGDAEFEFSDGPTSTGDDITFGLRNVGDGAASIVSFSVEIETPGRSPAPERFEKYEIEPSGTGESISGDSGYDVGDDIGHAPYNISPDGTAAYKIHDLDRSNLSEMTLTLTADDGTQFTLEADF